MRGSAGWKSVIYLTNLTEWDWYNVPEFLSETVRGCDYSYGTCRLDSDTDSTCGMEAGDQNTMPGRSRSMFRLLASSTGEIVKNQGEFTVPQMKRTGLNQG